MRIRKHIVSTAIAVALLLSMSVPAFATSGWLGSEYEMYEGVSTEGVFQNDTQYDLQLPPDPNETNTRRDKNAALTPIPDSIFGGYIATDYINPYYNNEQNNNSYVPPTDSRIASDSGFTQIASNSTGTWSSMDGSSVNSLTPNNSVLTENNTQHTGNTNGYYPNITEPTYFEDGTIGQIVIPALSYDISVYDNAGYYTMYYGFGLIEGTSAWDGNVALAGHNRGTPVVVGNIHKLVAGDKITYTTTNGTRTYSVSSVEKVAVSDTSVLTNSTSGNQLTLITCVAGQSNYRYCVIAYEV